MLLHVVRATVFEAIPRELSPMWKFRWERAANC